MHFVPLSSLDIAGTSEAWRAMVQEADRCGVKLDIRGRKSHNDDGKRTRGNPSQVSVSG